MNQKNKDLKINQILSAFLVVAYVVCMYFFSNFITGITSVPLQLIANVAMYVVFGLLLFYSTRVGEGKQIRRFSLSVLLLTVLPGLYIVLATFAPGLPLRNEIINSEVLSCLGYIMLGYGIPYTFFSGYELAQPEEDTGAANTFDLINQIEESNLEEKEETTEEEQAEEQPEAPEENEDLKKEETTVK